MSNRFKDARTKYNVNGHESVKEVSKATGITGSLIDDLETTTAKRDVGYSKIKTLAKHYGVSADFLLGLSDVPTRVEDINNACSCTGLNVPNVSTLHEIVEAIRKNTFATKREQVYLYAINEILSSQQFLTILSRIWDGYIIEHTRALNGLASKYPDEQEAAERMNEVKSEFNSYVYMGLTQERIVSGDVAISVLLNEAREAIVSIAKEIIKSDILEKAEAEEG